MDWTDIKNAADPVNAAYTPNQLLGYALSLLQRQTEGLPYTETHRAAYYCELATRAIQVADLIWTKHRRKKRDPEVDMVKSMERVLEEVRKLFVLGFGRDPFEVLNEERFDCNATVVCHANGYWLIGTYTGRFAPTDKDAEEADIIIRQDHARLREFESTDPIEWLRAAAMSRHKRQLWVHPAEKWASLRAAVENAVSSEPRRLSAETTD